MTHSPIDSHDALPPRCAGCTHSRRRRLAGLVAGSLLVFATPLVIMTTQSRHAGAQPPGASDTAESTPTLDGGAGEPFAVMELFTSQGCSSCPPADALLTRLIDEARRGDRRVFALSFHVDYWNRLGWVDPFSDETYSARQRAYAGAFGSGRVYTPQLVVNGREEFVGSDGERIQRALSSALAAKPATAMSIAVSRDAGIDGPATIGYRFEGRASGTLNVALVERDLSVDVPRGENGGRTLHHDNVVRVFRTFTVHPRTSGSVSIPVPKGIKRSDASIVAYLQDPMTMHITAAAMAPLP